MSVDPAWRDALEEFGKGLGFDDFALDGNGAVHNFVVGDDRYLLDLEFTGADNDCLAVVLFRQVPAMDQMRHARDLLRNCNYDEYLPFLVQVGLQGDTTLMLSIQLDKSSANQIHAAVEFLQGLYIKIGL